MASAQTNGHSNGVRPPIDDVRIEAVETFGRCPSNLSFFLPYPLLPFFPTT